ncbi:hypothetical protein TIFTF001_055930, partial [Ficus carica]
RRRPAGRGWDRWWEGRRWVAGVGGEEKREKGEERGEERDEKRENGEERETGSPASGVSPRRPSPVGKRSPATEKSLGGKDYVR